MRIGRLRAGCVELEVVRGGSGPAVLLLHGVTPFSPDAPFLRLLGQAATVVAPSHPGFGGSPRPDDVESVYDLIHVYRDVLDALPDEQVTLIGCSFGGWLAAELAIGYGHRLARLVLVDPVGIKVGGREERDITHLFNTHPAELARRTWHDSAKQRPGLLGLGWQQHLGTVTDEDL